ncbi:MAG TPA: hypothetical protein VLI07_18580 [Candidatus Binatus sp.]|nr:hypothetical protein [Candidatus Binatus sp.]
MAGKTTKDEPKLKLPAGHPQAGYVGPDLSLQDGVGTLPDDAQKEIDEANADREDEVAAVEDAEHKAAKQAQEEFLKAQEGKEASASSSSSSTSSKSSA